MNDKYWAKTLIKHFKKVAMNHIWNGNRVWESRDIYIFNLFIYFDRERRQRTSLQAEILMYQLVECIFISRTSSLSFWVQKKKKKSGDWLIKHSKDSKRQSKADLLMSPFTLTPLGDYHHLFLVNWPQLIIYKKKFN